MNPRALHSLRLWLGLLSMLLGSAARGQWLTQTFSLKTGWNAIYLHVDPFHDTLENIVAAADPTTKIGEIWAWVPPTTPGQFVVSPQNPSFGSRWRAWRRADPDNTTLNALGANRAYLVKVSSDMVLQLKGRPVAPRYQWTSSGQNLIGFPAVESTGPTFEQFLAKSPPSFQQTAEIFKYVGGELTGNPRKLTALRTEKVTRGSAYWVKAGENVYNRYYGPLEVVAGALGYLSFSNGLSVASIRLRNLAPQTNVVVLSYGSSENPPGSPPETPAATPPTLLVRGNRDTTTLRYTYRSLSPGAEMSWTLPPFGTPGADQEIVVGIDRSELSGNAGDAFAGILTLTDSFGQSRIDVGMSGAVDSTAGLWVGGVDVGQVRQYRAPAQMGPVGSSFPLRLIVHNPEASSGAATPPAASLLQQVFVGFDAATNPVVAALEGSLGKNVLSKARRITAVHLPWSAANLGWAFDGRLQPGARLRTSVTTAFDDHASNPFLHTYHPDHDNLDSGFREQLPRGAESYTVAREIVLSVQPPADDFESRIGVSQSLTGEYSEVVRMSGLLRNDGQTNARQFELKGTFSLNRLSRVSALTRP